MQEPEMNTTRHGMQLIKGGDFSGRLRRSDAFSKYICHNDDHELKKKYIGNENPSTVLILDNPFGKASAKHVLDPIFEIADKLNFQLICFAAPEIIKVEISERFRILGTQD